MLSIKDIVFRNNIRFPDNGKLDTKINGHPTVNLTEETENNIFFLRVSSQLKHYVQNMDKMVLIKPSRMNGLSKPSVVKVDHVLKERYRNIWPAGHLSDNDYTAVLDKLDQYKSKTRCQCRYCACYEYDRLSEVASTI